MGERVDLDQADLSDRCSSVELSRPFRLKALQQAEQSLSSVHRTEGEKHIVVIGIRRGSCATSTNNNKTKTAGGLSCQNSGYQS